VEGKVMGEWVVRVMEVVVKGVQGWGAAEEMVVMGLGVEAGREVRGWVEGEVRVAVGLEVEEGRVAQGWVAVEVMVAQG
jgi:hypothetical protein